MRFLERINGFVWGAPALFMILGAGIFLMVRTKFAQIRYFPNALSYFRKQLKKGDVSGGISPYSALCTALAATVGTGNIIGVAGAITLGGPGAVFWMWICALVGMAIKFSEATLAVRYRTNGAQGEHIGGPMYMINQGMGAKWKPLAVIYSIFGVVASFGVGNMTQINAILVSVDSIVNIMGGTTSILLNLLIAVVLAMVLGTVMYGGARRVGEAAQKLVPLASLCYLLLGAVVIVLRIESVPAAFSSIIKGAFQPKAVTGGMLGSAFVALRIGVSRGTFTNEAGMGTAAIAHAGANVAHPIEQGFMGIIEVFLDTVLICTMTALVILCSGISVPYGSSAFENLTSLAFSGVLGRWSAVILGMSVCCFAVATVIGWSLYGARCAQFLFGKRSWRYYVLAQVAVIVLCVFLNTGIVWLFAEIMNGLMVIPNVIALLCLSPEMVKLLENYKTGA